NTLYTISNGGSLWKTILGSGSWTLLNQGFRFDQRNMQAFIKSGGGTRILAAIGQNMMYSDNEGATFTPVAGISFPVAWGGNYVAKIIRLRDAGNTVYCLTRLWSAVPWGPRFWLYRSTDQGQSFTKIHEFTIG
ncbi:sialidase family protein, partial [Bradyrhizobium sp. NBAIM08]|uniref:sialidase family protein n=1 Tax=Bradyrhizobium sp. NBAIM08 TaxID=2793815 RepID=UPI001CD768A7